MTLANQFPHLAQMDAKVSNEPDMPDYDVRTRKARRAARAAASTTPINIWNEVKNLGEMAGLAKTGTEVVQKNIVNG